MCSHFAEIRIKGRRGMYDNADYDDVKSRLLIFRMIATIRSPTSLPRRRHELKTSRDCTHVFLHHHQTALGNSTQAKVTFPHTTVCNRNLKSRETTTQDINSHFHHTTQYSTIIEN